MRPRLLDRVSAGLARVPFISAGFVRDAFTLTAGVAVSQVITLAAAPVLTRVYTPDAFGAFAAFTAVTTTIAMIVCLSYEPAIVLPRGDGEAAALLALCLVNVLTVSAVTGIAMVLFGDRVLAGATTAGGEWPLWWVPLQLSFIGVYQALTYWSTRRKQFRTLSTSRVGQATVTAAMQIGGRGPVGLIAGVVVGQLVASGMLVMADARRILRHWRAEPPRARVLLACLREYRRFPIYSSWGTIVNGAAFQVVPLLLLALFGSSVVGLYFLGARMASIPMSLAGSAIGQMVLQRSADRLGRGEPVGPLIETVLGKLILVSVVPFVALATAAPAAFAFVFGDEWRAAGTYLRVLTPLFFAQFLTSPVSMVLFALQRQRVVAGVQTALLAGALLSFGVAAWLKASALQSLALYAGVQSALYLVYLALVVRSARASLRTVLREAVSLEIESERRPRVPEAAC